jgi:hypothetical protein
MKRWGLAVALVLLSAFSMAYSPSDLKQSEVKTGKALLLELKIENSSPVLPEFLMQPRQERQDLLAQGYECKCPSNLPKCVINSTRREYICAPANAVGCAGENKTWYCLNGTYCSGTNGGCT